MIAHSHKLTGLVIEFHNINNDSNFEQLLNFIGKIDLKLVHLHVNNWFYYRHFDDCIPDILELTFTASSNIVYRRDLTLPRSMDQPNNPMDKDFAIRFGISKS